MEEALAARTAELEAEEMGAALERDTADVTLPGDPFPLGALHPITQIRLEMEDILLGLGYRIADGPEVETEWHNFTALNTPAGHPARSPSDTFFIEGRPDRMLRTQTSPVQVREMQRSGPPMYLIAPGAVYRRDDVDATHSPMFHQMEGLAVDEGLTLAHLKGTMLHFFRELLGADREILLQPHFFPFTEPSVDVQVSYIDKCRPAELARAGGRRDGRPQRARGRGHRLGALHRLRLRLRPGPHRDDPLRRAGPAPVLRGRPALPGAVRVRVPLSWVTDHVDPGLPAQELAGALSGSGTLVEAIHHLGVPEGTATCPPSASAACSRRSPTPTPTGCACARSTSARASRRGIVCGAPNVAAGQTVAVALPGALLPGADRPLKVAKLRGVESRGMILSATELALGEDAAGIMVLPDGIAPGTPSRRSCPSSETVLELEITSNRPDCLAVWGVAREIHAVTGAPLAPLDESEPPVEGEGEVATTRRSQIDAPDLCPRYMARVLTDVTWAPRRRGCATGWRPPACGRSPTWSTSPTT